MSEQNGSKQFPPRTVAHNMGEFIHDCVTLAELQLDLLKLDASDFLKRLIPPVGLFFTALVMIFGSVPILLAALALGLIEAGLPPWAAFLLSTGAGLLFAVLTGLIGWWLLRKSPSVFHRSTDELRNNTRWVKHVMRSKSTDSDSGSMAARGSRHPA